MTRRPTIFTRPLCRLLLVIAAAGIVFAASGCGGGVGATTSSTVHLGESADAAAAQAVKEMSDYAAALRAWFQDYVSLAESQGQTALEFEEPIHPTDSEVARAHEVIEVMRTSVAEFRKIAAPGPVAGAHSRLGSALSGELTALDRYVSALGWGSERDVELAYRQAEESYALLVQALEELGPYVDLSDFTQN